MTRSFGWLVSLSVMISKKRESFTSILLSELLSNSFLLKEFDLLKIRRESSLSTWAMKLCSHEFACLLHNKIALAQNGAKLEKNVSDG